MYQSKSPAILFIPSKLALMLTMWKLKYVQFLLEYYSKSLISTFRFFIKSKHFFPGKQSAFIRSCSTLDPSVPWEGCVNDTSTPGQLQTKCYILCFEDGCNNSYVTSGQIFPVFILSSLLFLASNGWFWIILFQKQHLSKVKVTFILWKDCVTCN